MDDAGEPITCPFKLAEMAEAAAAEAAIEESSAPKMPAFEEQEFHMPE